MSKPGIKQLRDLFLYDEAKAPRPSQTGNAKRTKRSRIKKAGRQHRHA